MSQVELTKTATPDRHRERIGAKRQGKQQRADNVEAGPIRLRLPAISRQIAVGETKCQQAQWHVDEEDRPPTGSGNQQTAERGTESGADRRHRSEQPHGAAGPCLRHRLTDKSHGQGHHDGRRQALGRPGCNQQPERRRDATQDRGHRKQEQPGQQQPPATGDVT